MMVLSLSGKYQAGQDTVSPGSVIGSSLEADFSENHHVSQRLLGLIVRGLDIRIFEKGK